ncbi:MAG: hypothetical protein ACK5JS_05885 [Mangrovibacterium sp.]
MKNKITVTIVVLVVLLGAFSLYKWKMDATKIAFVNYPDFLYTKLAISAQDSHCDVYNVKQEDLSNLGDYDVAIFLEWD